MKCPCQSQKEYSVCCAPFIEGIALPKNPEELMRSRYTAFSQSNIEYICQTMIGPALEGFDKKAAEKWSKEVTWQGLEIIFSAVDNDRGTVEFIAKYALNGKPIAMHEVSIFHKIEGKWFYYDGEVKNANTPFRKEKEINRNDPCSCGSGKKYKKCCHRNG